MVAQNGLAAAAAELLVTSRLPDDLLPTDVLVGYGTLEDGEARLYWPTANPDLPVVGMATLSPEEGDPDAVMAGLLPDWRPASAWRATSTGQTLAGWRFATVQRDLLHPADAYLTALVAVLGGDGRRQALWGLGNPARTVLDGGSVLRVLHALPVIEEVDPAVLVGTWRNATDHGLLQYRFGADGTFESGIGASTSFGLLETTTGSTRSGSYRIVDGVLELAEADRVRSFHARVQDELGYGAETPIRTLGLLPVDSGDEVEYARVVE